MVWIQFDEHDRRSPAPPFCLPTAGGSAICRDDFRERCSLVVYFSAALPCPACYDLLAGFTQRVAEYQAHDARILAVFPSPPDAGQAALFSGEAGIAWASDPQGATRQAYMGLIDASLVKDGESLLFILDQYGSPYVALANAEKFGPEIHSRALSWLDFIGIQCPE